MEKYRVYQHFEGAVERVIEADSVEEAERKMQIATDIILDEMMDCNWDYPEVVEVLESGEEELEVV